MPQFDPTSFSSQLFWLIIFFVLLYRYLTRVVIPRLGGVIEDREKTVQEDINRADEFKARTNAAIAAYEKALAEARGQAQAVLKETQEELARVAEARQRAVGEALARRIEEGEARIAGARSRALEGVREAASEVVVAVTDKLMGDAVGAGRAQASVDAVMREAR